MSLITLAQMNTVLPGLSLVFTCDFQGKFFLNYQVKSVAFNTVVCFSCVTFHLL